MITLGSLAPGKVQARGRRHRQSREANDHANNRLHGKGPLAGEQATAGEVKQFESPSDSCLWASDALCACVALPLRGRARRAAKSPASSSTRPAHRRWARPFWSPPRTARSRVSDPASHQRSRPLFHGRAARGPVLDPGDAGWISAGDGAAHRGERPARHACSKSCSARYFPRLRNCAASPTSRSPSDDWTWVLRTSAATRSVLALAG